MTVLSLFMVVMSYSSSWTYPDENISWRHILWACLWTHCKWGYVEKSQVGQAWRWRLRAVVSDCVRLGEMDWGGGGVYTCSSFLLCPWAWRCRKEPRGTSGRALEPVDSMCFMTSHGTKGHPGEVVRRKTLPQMRVTWSRGRGGWAGEPGSHTSWARVKRLSCWALGVGAGDGGLSSGWADRASKREFWCQSAGVVNGGAPSAWVLCRGIDEGTEK